MNQETRGKTINSIPTEESGKPQNTVGERRWPRHLAVGLMGLLMVYLFWLSRMEWDSEMRTWRAVGDSAFMLLLVTMAIGPLGKIWPGRFSALVNWRRAFGVWFAMFASVHAFLVWDGWARWSIKGFLGYQDLAIIGFAGKPILVDPGFGLSNLIGLVALFWGLVLFATSSDWAVNKLGTRAWKHIQSYANLILYLVVLHAAYYLFLHYELSLRNLFFQRGTPSPNWFRFWFLGLAVFIFILQMGSYLVELRRRKIKVGQPDEGGEA